LAEEKTDWWGIGALNMSTPKGIAYHFAQRSALFDCPLLAFCPHSSTVNFLLAAAQF
jgi:hypothetical protein